MRPKPWIFLFPLAAACGARAPDAALVEAAGALTVQSIAFGQDGTIPARYTFDGANVSPPLSWSVGPRNTVSYAVVMDDSASEAGFVNWVIWNVPGAQLDEDTPPAPNLPSGAVQGRNSSARIGYSGPQPPAGTTHTYTVRVYALDTQLQLAPESNRTALLDAMRDHVLASGELSARYTRPK